MLECPYGRVDGQQPQCISTEQRCDNVTDCFGGEDELEHNCPCGPEGEVRLVGSILPYQGRVEYCQNGRWATICRRAWDNSDAAVVCRSLGYHSKGIYDRKLLHGIQNNTYYSYSGDLSQVLVDHL